MMKLNKNSSYKQKKSTMALSVGIFLITYNHEEYIKQAIDSILSQITNFDFKLIIGEDFSTDNTRAICQEYAEKFPDKIILLPSDKNYGAAINAARTLEACRIHKYTAVCEGDDYWIDPYKLQKQVDFLESNPSFTICFSDAQVIDELNAATIFFPEWQKNVFNIKDFILSPINIIPTPSLIFRNVLPQPLPSILEEAMSGDIVLQLLLADKGNAKFINEKLAAYRNHSGGISKSKENIEKGEEALKQTYIKMNEYLGYKYDAVFKERFLNMARTKLIHGAKDKHGLARLKHYFKAFPEYLKNSSRINLKEIAYYHAILFFPFLLRKKK